MGYFNQDRRMGGRKSYGEGGDRQMYQAVCSKCGKDCRVPFMPSGDKPVYCSDCFERTSQGSGRRESRPYSPSSPQSQNQNNDLLVSINAKLGKILELMTEKKVTKKTKKVEPEKSVNSLEQ